MKHHLIWLALLAGSALSAGCSHKEIARTDYSLERYGDLLVSNSESLGTQPRQLDHHTELRYSAVIHNTSERDAYRLQLDQVRLTANGTIAEARCRRFDPDRDYFAPHAKSEPLSIGTQANVRVDCAISLNADGQNRLAMKDTEAKLSIPYSSEGGGTTGAIQFNYYLKIEDFE